MRSAAVRSALALGIRSKHRMRKTHPALRKTRGKSVIAAGARVANPRCLRRLAIGAQVSNLPHYRDFQVPKPRAKKPIAMARRNTISHMRSPTSHPLTSSRKKPAPIAKYHQAKSRARSPFPMFLVTLDAAGALADANGSCDIMVQFLIDRAP
jgi:hypothetical protein